MSQEIREQVLNLMKQKDKIEDEIKQLTEILTVNGVGMSDPLVDAEDFPLNSVDVYQVRHARQRIICLQNDHKNIMKQIENGLQGYYSSSGSNQSNGLQDIEMRSDHNSVTHETPFAKVTMVSPNSPAEMAGLHADDFIVEFGSINSSNFKNLSDVATVVQHSEDNQIPVKVKRGQRIVPTVLVPKKWQGRGLLGCNIDVLK
ncbi:26S proteasome non-ATPase regulatory subunit 9 [Tribolium castaneum]|uniref:26S proteasome non-ATPase regulatory subunit 9-like Protein n=1 Tax=Tribolium castaneum TaxID=7070 RepID=D6WQX6_TRICA|nr:PREDICTED: 26S proteasome non-ATPase regulatory subunit 9 [Tribolium castaneum]EFA06519.1 26S proteasome non-ATPase regulatory subunit 9-like Protein [Tribolium castaneum]|eukprot:XP_968374.1 PREDICTED: 26S proteasome non-ATPase regulatory subunit 9 [Tribolium castaneum]